MQAVDHTSQSPLVSIITVVFNSEKLLDQTIQSIISQKYKNIEYIIIDGGSTDSTVDIIKKYKHEVAYWISEPDRGLYDAMNKGLAAAKGDYVWFINSGDRIYDDEILEKVFPKNVVLFDIYYGQTMMIDEVGQVIGSRRLKPGRALNWRSLKMGMLVSHQSFIVKRELAPFYDLRFKFSADFDWMIKVLKKTSSIKNTELVLSEFLDGGLTKQNILPGLKERFRIMSYYYGLVPTIFRHFIIGAKFLIFLIRHRRF